MSRFMEGAKEADCVVVLDTGSTDHTVSALQKAGAMVYSQHISPWRFDSARNASLALVPEYIDICVCVDLDEVFHPGWRQALEMAWQNDTGKARYRYTWSFTPEGKEGVVFWIEKAHRRHGYLWSHPVHEILQWCGEGREPPTITVEGMQLDHHPDATKSRGQYLPLLELSVAECPTDDRNMHYLGREYMYAGRLDEAISTLLRHLALPSATWADERCASMRYIAKCYLALENDKEAQRWLLRAIAEAPYLREPWLDYALLAYKMQAWHLLVWLTEQALAIKTRPTTYITEAESWGALPYDLASLGYFYLGAYEKAHVAIKSALALSQTDTRLKQNLAIIETHLPSP